MPHKLKNKPRITSEYVEAAFEKQAEYHPQEKLNEKKRKIILQRLKDGYSVPDLHRAIVGCHNTPHNQGVNERNTKYLGLHISLKSENIDRFIEVGQEWYDERDKKRALQEARRGRVKAEEEKAVNLSPEERAAELAEFRLLRRKVGI